jgi:2-hydroxychromene-2-carboxylate isomerase
MHTFLDSKAMARALRSALAERQIDISHSDSLELVARQFGFDDWNMLAARIEAGRPRRLPPGWQTHHGAG